MDQHLEQLLTALAFSNFYFTGNTDALLVGQSEIEERGRTSPVVILGPKDGSLDFTFSNDATAYQVHAISSQGIGRILIRPQDPAKDPYHYPYDVHHLYLFYQRAIDLPDLAFEEVLVTEYCKLAGRR